jgi:hypothetical protein
MPMAVTRYPVIGDGIQVALPTRLRCGELPAHMIPRSELELSVHVDSNRGVDMAFMHSVVERWRVARPDQPKPGGEWGAFATEAGRPLLAAGHAPGPCRLEPARKPPEQVAVARVRAGHRAKLCGARSRRGEPDGLRARPSGVL